ncbi:ABC transporter ATP-binding protein [Merismopedia glauca]|uniref:ABC transporter ATP-binding protein n=1 Tax=Merismopedia glauca CCAP 1448/3 TaxID=1296344 RepID=A0A2T1C8J3_9CYAN|nr:ABC transporter ATP-binding protein [Merismopedia glauca]PSB04564.1 ABC transporter ATP-binding protein [Merismopedia glauca CCAP 1448/3]
MSDTVLEVRNLDVEFPAEGTLKKAVNGVSFTLKRGECLGIVGESGSGKSVTALAIMDLVPPPGVVASGEIIFSPMIQGKALPSVNLMNQNMQKYRGSQIATIFQEPMSSLNPLFTIGFQLTEAIAQHQHLFGKDARRDAVARLEEVKLFSPQATNQEKWAILERYPHQLSGGQLQRVMIAMALACDPVILIADEPTTALDVTVQKGILELLRELRDRRQMSMLFITHDFGVVAEIANQVVVMYRGKIVDRGETAEIFSSPQSPYTKALLACRPRLDREKTKVLPTVSDFMEVVTQNDDNFQLLDKPLAATDLQALVTGKYTDRESEEMANSSHGTNLLKVRNLRVGFPLKGVFGQTQKYKWGVDDVSFEVYEGETLGIVGESGCGKTTLARTLLGLIKPISGKVQFGSQEASVLDARLAKKLKTEMQIVFQNPQAALNPRMKIGEAVVEPLVIHHRIKNSRQQKERAGELLASVGLEPSWINRYPHQISGGQRQRVCIARALALRPRLIICDEAVSALDVSVQAQILNLLKQLQQDFNLTYIFISHDLSVVKFMSDRIMVMNQGKIEEIDQAQNIYLNPTQDYTRKLISAIPNGTIERIEELKEVRSQKNRLPDK